MNKFYKLNEFERLNDKEINEVIGGAWWTGPVKWGINYIATSAADHAGSIIRGFKHGYKHSRHH